MNNLYEYSVKPNNEKKESFKMKLFRILKYVTFILTVLTAWFAFLWSNFLWVLAGIFLLLGIVFAYLQSTYLNYYDFSYVEGEFKLVKVKNGLKRKLIVKTSGKFITKIGKVNGETYNRKVGDKSVKKIVATDKVNCDDVVFLIENDEVNLLIITKYNEQFMAHVIKNVGVRQLDGDYVSYLRG